VLTTGPADRRGRLLPKGGGLVAALVLEVKAVKGRAAAGDRRMRLSPSSQTAAGGSNRIAWIDTRTLPPVKAPPADVITTGVSA